ncbi:PREDICTED: ubiquitin-conjugating enzyme E2 Z [Cyprinodon variegatus]|uniref:ubiquitin-conjugating enzyme E2 Z n=1 Tax=Cyprinodon variegatus TaxID=28743 RepID=UPI000742CDB9|nr:PREDICTED: ubiquitin-conjugating enzyme E2 Z [Cyprinodon variegatus]
MADSFGEEYSGGGHSLGVPGQGGGAFPLPALPGGYPAASGAHPSPNSASPSPATTPAAPGGLAAVVSPISAVASSAMGFGNAFSSGPSPPVLAVSPIVHTSSPLPGVGQGVAGLAGGGLLSQIHATSWDPTLSADWDNEKASQTCILRIKSVFYCSTWTGPAWSPAQSISSVLISIQSLMTENPYHNEPGFEQERHPGDSKNYNECIRHETMRVAVCDMLEGKVPCPEALSSVMEKSFLEYYDFYEGVCKERLHLQGQNMQDPFGEKRGCFDYQSLLVRLGATHRRIREKSLAEDTRNDNNSDSDTSSSETDLDSQGSSQP